MAQIIPFRPNRLLSPGTKPGVDLAHPASAGLVFSAVPSPGGGLKNLSTAYGAITATTPPLGTPVMDGVLGSALNSSRGSTNFYQITLPSLVPSAVTYGAIHRPATTPGYYWVGFSTGAGNQGPIVNASSQFGLFNGAYSALQQLTLGVPYFLAATCSANTYIITLLKNLNTGQVTTTSLFSGTTLSQNDSSGAAILGDTSGGSFSGTCAAVMYSHKALSMPQLLRWADDPWSFWYPQQLDLMEMVKTPAAVAAAAQGATLPFMGVGG